MARRGGAAGAGLFKHIAKWLKARTRHPRYRHVFHGDVDMGAPGGPRGRGFHHRFGGQDPPTARVRTDADGNPMILSQGVDGTYRARVDVLGPDGNWYPKPGSSTFFPDNWTPQRVDGAINGAFDNRVPGGSSRRWRGEADGLAIEGSYDPRNPDFWDSAWPIIG
jgi:hypothetical protein